MALAKVALLCFADTDNVIFEFFGNLIFRDPDHSSNGMVTVNSTGRSMQVQAPRKHVWQRAFRLDHLDAIFFGLANVLDALVHPSILNKESLLKLHRKIRNASTRFGCHTLIPKLLNV